MVYAAHLRKQPLKGMPAKPVILQFAKGDHTHPNPTTTAMLRAGDLAEQATYYWNDLAFAMDLAVPKGPAHVSCISSICPSLCLPCCCTSLSGLRSKSPSSLPQMARWSSTPMIPLHGSAYVALEEMYCEYCSRCTLPNGQVMYNHRAITRVRVVPRTYALALVVKTTARVPLRKGYGATGVRTSRSGKRSKSLRLNV